MEELDLSVIDETMENLRKNNMLAFFVATKDEVVPLVKDLVEQGSVVSNGGSQTLKESGVSRFLSSGYYKFIDRTKAKTPEEQRRLYIEAFGADAYFCSSNAVTVNGELYNVDGNSNRVACIVYGPSQVIMVVGYNKIVTDINEAANRVKTVAAPENCRRLNIQTYCGKTGHCMSLDTADPLICDGCVSDERICCNYVVSAHQRHKDRIKVIIVGEKLGY